MTFKIYRETEDTVLGTFPISNEIRNTLDSITELRKTLEHDDEIKSLHRGESGWRR